MTDDRSAVDTQAGAVLDKIDFGLGVGGELDVTTTFCSEVRDCRRPSVIDQATADARYRDHRTPEMYAFESYIAVPIFRASGEYFGNLCALDPLPAKVSEQKTAELREQFIAVLGHDLRTRLSAILHGAEALRRIAPDPRAAPILERVRRSCGRISQLVDDVLDFARGRLGGGTPLAVREVKNLGDDLRHVVAELESAYLGRGINASIDITTSVFCDRARVAQRLSKCRPGRPRARPLHRRGDRALARRHPGRQLLGGRDDIHVQDSRDDTHVRRASG